MHIILANVSPNLNLALLIFIEEKLVFLDENLIAEGKKEKLGTAAVSYHHPRIETISHPTEISRSYKYFYPREFIVLLSRIF